MRQKSQISRYACDTSGNFAIMSSIMFPVLLSFIGIAITVSDVRYKQARLQNHSDNMSLFMAKLTHEDAQRGGFEAIGAFDKYKSLYNPETLREGEDCDFSLHRQHSNGTTTSRLTCTGTVKTFLPSFTGLESLNYEVKSTATVTDQIFEIAFVFDISDSMVGAEMEELRVTLDDLTDSALFDHNESRLSLIPFANTVRLDDRFKQFVDPATGYDETNGVYTGCFDREATDPTIDIKKTSGYPLVNVAIASGREVCPNEDMTAIFHKSADDWAVKDVSSKIDLAFGTAMSDGLVWGYRSLDPDLRGVLSDDTRYPLVNNKKTSKHVIMMTDGRPYDRPYHGPGGGKVTQQISLERFETVCSQLEFDKKGISFHLINFNNNKLTDEQVNIYKNCVAGEGQYYEAKSGELSKVVSQIANQVGSLRISE